MLHLCKSWLAEAAAVSGVFVVWRVCIAFLRRTVLCLLPAFLESSSPAEAHSIVFSNHCSKLLFQRAAAAAATTIPSRFAHNLFGRTHTHPFGNLRPSLVVLSCALHVTRSVRPNSFHFIHLHSYAAPMWAKRIVRLRPLRAVYRAPTRLPQCTFAFPSLC